MHLDVLTDALNLITQHFTGATTLGKTGFCAFGVVGAACVFAGIIVARRGGSKVKVVQLIVTGALMIAMVFVALLTQISGSVQYAAG